MFKVKKPAIYAHWMATHFQSITTPQNKPPRPFMTKKTGAEWFWKIHTNVIISHIFVFMYTVHTFRINAQHRNRISKMEFRFWVIWSIIYFTKNQSIILTMEIFFSLEPLDDSWKIIIFCINFKGLLLWSWKGRAIISKEAFIEIAFYELS